MKNLSRVFMAGAVALTIVGCGSNPKMLAEKADTDASLAYVTVATVVNTYESRPDADMAKGEALKLEAWKALVIERQAYALTGTVDLTALTVLVTQAKSL